MESMERMTAEAGSPPRTVRKSQISESLGPKLEKKSIKESRCVLTFKFDRKDYIPEIGDHILSAFSFGLYVIFPAPRYKIKGDLFDSKPSFPV